MLKDGEDSHRLQITNLKRLGLIFQDARTVTWFLYLDRGGFCRILNTWGCALGLNIARNLFVSMLFVTRACYIKSHFVDSIVECQLYTYHISLLFQFITHCATDIFHQGQVTQKLLNSYLVP